MADWLIILAALALLAGLMGWLFHWYVLSAVWWPLVGREWRQGGAWDRREGYAYWRKVPTIIPGQDDEWAERLHVLNADLIHGLGRPVAQLTHYEVEAVIRQLGVAEWVPERWRAAA